jgi:uncharacterized membrane protein YoaK (UPF0700 family)
MKHDDGAAEDREQALLVPLLLLMTIVTGAVDAVSILRLGHVFVANMTGNVVFLGFALAGSSGFSVSASVVALGAFLGGAAVGGRTLKSPRRIHALCRAAAAEAGLVAAATLVALSASGSAARYSMTVLLAAAMGAQNAAVRSLGVPDLTTTVLTLTLTGLAADPPRLSESRSPARRRVSAVAAMLAGAVSGALLVLHASTAAALGAATALLVAVAAASGWWARWPDRPGSDPPHRRLHRGEP